MCLVAIFLFNVFFAAVIHAVLVRFSEDPYIFRDLFDLEGDLGEDGVKVDPCFSVRTEVWCTLYADDAGIESKSAEDIEETMTVIV